MKVENKYSFYFVNKLAIFLPVGIALYIFEIDYMANIVVLYVILKSIFYFIFYEDFVIEKDKIILLSSKNEEYHFDTFAKIIFIEKYLLLFNSQRIKIVFSDGYEREIKCDGLSSDDEYINSFYRKYEYTKSIFPSTYYHEESFLQPLLPNKKRKKIK